MFQKEWKKLWCVQRYRYYFFILLICFICIQMVSIYTTRLGDSYLPADYKKLCEKVKDREALSALNQLETEYETMLSSDFQLGKADLYQDVLNEMNIVLKYPTYLKNVQLRSGVTLSALFASDYDKKVNEIQREKYKILSADGVEFCKSRGLALFCKTDYSDMLFFFGLVLLVLGLVTREYEENVMALFVSSYLGTGKIFRCKYIVGVVHAILLQGLLQGIKLVLYLRAYGFSAWDRRIQSVSGFVQSTFDGTAGEFLLYFIGIKVLAGILLFSMLFLVCAYAKSSLRAVVLSGMLFGVFLWCMLGVSANDWLNVLKMISPFQLLFTKELLSADRYINFFNIPIKVLDFWLVLSLLLAAFCLLWGRMKFWGRSTTDFSERFRKRNKYKEKGWYRKIQFCKKKIQPNGLWYSLWKHCFLQEGIIVLFLLAGIFMVATYRKQEIFFDDETEYYCYQYIKELEGTYTAEKKEWILEEEKRLQDISDEIAENAGLYSDSAMEILKQEQGKSKGLYVVSDYAEYLEKIDEAAFIYEPGYELLLGIKKEGSDLFLYNLLALFLIAIAATAMWGQEEWSGMECLISCLYIGEKRYRKKQRLLIMWYATVISLIVYSPWIYNVVQGYGLTVWQNSCQSMQSLKGFPVNLTLAQVCGLYYFLHYIYIIIIGEAARIVQKRISSQAAATVVIFVISILPLLWNWNGE